MNIDSGNSLFVERDRGMCVTWFLAGSFCIVFACVPWYMIVFRVGTNFQWATHWQGLIFLVVWSALPGFAGLWMLFQATCSIRLILDNDALIIIRKTGPIKRIKRYPSPAGIYLLYRWRHRKNGPDQKLMVLILRLSGNKKKLVLEEIEARNLAEVFEWLCASTSIKYRDLRNHKIFG